jgi:hypothetical protein
MACRLINLHAHPLRIELRGGGELLLAPGARSRALREELLYDNDHLREWERAGWVRRIPAPMAEVLAAEQRVPAPSPRAARRAKQPKTRRESGRKSGKKPPSGSARD